MFKQLSMFNEISRDLSLQFILDSISLINPLPKKAYDYDIQHCNKNRPNWGMNY